MRNLIFHLFIFFSIFTALAQRERNYIYLLDCTQSMQGYNGAPDIWDETKDYLKNDLSLLDSNSSAIVIPFQDKIFPIISMQGNDIDWDKIESKIDKYVKNITRTNICDAWDAGLKCIDPNKDNYLYILTDGADNCKGISLLSKKIRDWCGKNKNIFAFYVMLTKNACNPEVENAINACNNIVAIKANEHPSPFGSLNVNSVAINTRELHKTYRISFSAIGEYEISVVTKNPHFDIIIINNKIQNGYIDLKFVSKYGNDIALLNKSIGDSESYSFDFEIIPSKKSNIQIFNSTLTAIVCNKAERVLDIIDNEHSIGKATFYDSFLFWGEKTQDSLRIDLKAKYNIDATNDDALTVFAVDSSGNSLSKAIILYNGERIGESFKISNSDKASILTVIFNKDAPSEKHYFPIILKSYRNIDRINNHQIPVSQSIFTLRAEYSEEWNPLKIFLFWVLVVIILAFVMWMLIKPMVIQKIKIGFIRIQGPAPYHCNKRVQNATKIVFTNIPKKRSWLLSLLAGKVIYIVDEVWTSEWEIIPIAGGKCKAITKGKYTISPFSSNLVKAMEYQLTNNSDSKLFKIILT